MANMIMPNIVSQITPGKGVDPKAQVPVGKDGSFAQHLQRQANAERAVKENMMGKVRAAKRNTEDESPNGVDQAPASVEALLQQVMQYLQKAVDEPGSEAGQWSFQLQDIGMLEKLAIQAGMDSSALAALRRQMEQQGGLPLADLFAALEKNFKELGEGPKVTVPETYLPLLDSFLARLGASPEQIQRVDGLGVNGVDQLDLEAFLQGFNDIASSQTQGQDEAPSFILTDWEREQLSAMFAEAGVPADVIETMFPEVKTLEENALAGLRSGQGDVPVTMTMERLNSLMQQAVAAAEDARPKANLPGFLDDLHLVMSQAGFQEEGVGWTPVVHGAMQAVYERLQEMVSSATVKVDTVSHGGVKSSADLQQAEGWLQLKEEKNAQDMAENELLDQQWLSNAEEPPAEVPVIESAEVEVSEIRPDGQVGVKVDRVGDVQVQQGGEVKSVDPGADLSVKFQAPRIRVTPELQQFAVEQISSGVFRGLRNNDHHLAMTLYPKELGEVKVDLQVRGSHLSVTFVMENQKVKEAMEANMGDFKDNLERRGFTLGEMSVSVDQHNHSAEDQKQFARAWAEMIENQVKDQKNQIQPGVLAEMTTAGQSHSLHGGISVFV